MLRALTMPGSSCQMYVIVVYCRYSIISRRFFTVSKFEYRDMVRGIAVVNPVDVEYEYFMYTVDYAIEHGITHMQLVGPTHDYVKGNIDGMTPYRKYAQFNAAKNQEYVDMCLDAVNRCCDKAAAHGVKVYLWHHELDLPDGFADVYPEILNSDGDIEVTHPVVRDFLESRIEDFFAAYPNMAGIILTLHETKVPLLRLKNQKLDKIGRVKYVTEILFNSCRKLGKELIVRPFASVEEDYEMMMQAYESISGELVVMDKWTQFDWSLTMPHNRFFEKIKNNPMMVETDIFGEFFGKGRVPLMLRKHIMEKFAYCEGFKPVGYCNRIDRNGQIPFGSVNEVNLDIMNACMQGKDVDEAIDAFFEKNYPGVAKEVRAIMEPTEDVLSRIIYLKGFLFSELSSFPRLNHCKNHFYIEMMKDNYEIVSGEWFIPNNWDRGSIESVLEEKDSAVRDADHLYEEIVKLRKRMDPDAYDKIWYRFANLRYIAHLWRELAHIFLNYAKYFETRDPAYEEAFNQAIKNILDIDREANLVVGKRYYCSVGDSLSTSVRRDFVPGLVKEVTDSFRIEKRETEKLEAEGLVDFVVCGGGMEAHRLMKEVNFSDTYIEDDQLHRICGTYRGKSFSQVNTHGWFSYELKVKPGVTNDIVLTLGTKGESIDIQVTIDGVMHEISQKGTEPKDFVIPYEAKSDAVRIRFDRFTPNTPCVYTIRVKA